MLKLSINEAKIKQKWTRNKEKKWSKNEVKMKWKWCKN